MLKVVPTGRFRKDYALMKRRGKDMGRLSAIVEQLAALEPLDLRHRDHALSGNFEGLRDCHIEPDWVLIYQVEDDELRLIRCGSHADLF